MTEPTTTGATSYSASSTNGGVVTLVSVTILDDDFLPGRNLVGTLRDEIETMAEELLESVEDLAG